MTEDGPLGASLNKAPQGTHLRALRSSLRVDVSYLSPVAGAVTALPVVAVFVVGLMAGTDSGAIAMAVGANLIAIASLVGAPRLSFRIAIIDAVFLGLSVLVGTLSGSITWLHLLILVPWCFGAGMLEVFDQTSATVGSQAVIAYVVLGRFTGSFLFAVHFSLLVMLGALVEVLALAVLRLPSSLRFQRTRLATSYEAVARLVIQDPNSTATNALSSLDDTEKTLNDPALFGRTDVREIRAIFDQVRRIRLELTTLSGIRVRLIAINDQIDDLRVAEALAPLSTALIEIANALRRRSQSSWRSSAAEFDARIDTLENGFSGSPESLVLASQCVEHLRAIAGQLRAAAKLVDVSGQESGKRIWRPSLPEFSSPDLSRLRTNALTLKDNLTPNSPAFRHAVRLAAAVPAAAFLGSTIGLPRSFWLTFAVLVILKPDYSSLLDRGFGRMIGTIIGATFAALLIGGLHPDIAVTVILVSFSAWVAYSTWYASFAISFGFITALVLVLMSITTTDTLSTALDRLLDFSLGSVIALVAYLIWPTSFETSVNDALANLYGAIERYLIAVFDVVERRHVEPGRVVALSRAMRVAWIKAESAIGRGVAEPGLVPMGTVDARSQLATTMRILRALHAIRIEAERGITIEAASVVDDLAQGCAYALRTLRESNEENKAPSASLRSLYRQTEKYLKASEGPESLSIHLDELVNAINTATELAKVTED